MKLLRILLTAMYLSVCVLATLGVSAAPPPTKFSYSLEHYRRSDDCHICYGSDCLPLDQSRCEYYVEADAMLHKDEEDPEGFVDPHLRNDVDSLIFDIIEKAELNPDLECIPYLSRYTDCDKENVCIHCMSCHCDHQGMWNCSSEPYCHLQEPAIDIDHRVLIMAMENIMETQKPSRERRSATNSPFDTNISTLTLEQLADWVYGEKTSGAVESKDIVIMDGVRLREVPITHGTITTTAAPTIHTAHTSPEVITESLFNPDADYIAFDEVLRNIAVDTKNYTRRKLPMDIEPNNNTFNFDYMLIDEKESNATIDNDMDITMNNNVINTKVNNTENTTDISYAIDFLPGKTAVTEGPVDDATKIVIDLLDFGKEDIFNETNFVDITNDKDDLIGVGFDNTNDVDFKSIQMKKRDIAAVSDTVPTANLNNISTTTETNTQNVTQMINIEDIMDIRNTTNKNNTKLKEDVLIPLARIIYCKQKQLETLRKVGENLVKYMKFNGDPSIGQAVNMNFTNVDNVDILPDIRYDLRRTNTNITEKLLYKLKRDTYEVIKDITELQRYKQGKLPEDMTLLVHALKRYVKKNKPFKTIPKFQNYRRSYVSKCMAGTFQQCMVELLQTIDKDMPKDHALAPLSKPVRKIMRNVILTYYPDEFTSIGLKVHDSNYNLTTDLIDIGSKWQDLTDNVIGSTPFVTLYNLKLLHFVLETDIKKINDALALIDFAHSRRMVPYFRNVKSDVLDHIKQGLRTIHNKVQLIVRYYARNMNTGNSELRYHSEEDKNTTTKPIDIIKVAIEQRKKKKHSFIKHLRNLLKSSKSDITELLKKQVPKSEIVKHLARKKLDELTQKRYNEYENAMRRWQTHLGVAPRFKRHLLSEVSKRIKSIIPNYLRHKVHPKLHEKKKNTTRKVDKKKGKKKKKHGPSHKKTTLTTASTHRSRTTARTTTPKYTQYTTEITVKPKKHNTTKH